MRGNTRVTPTFGDGCGVMGLSNGEEDVREVSEVVLPFDNPRHVMLVVTPLRSRPQGLQTSRENDQRPHL